jgi:uncharacterized protein (UPF0332 family)
MALSHSDLLSISEAKKYNIDQWRNGIRLEFNGGASIDTLIRETVRARLLLADEMRNQGHLALGLNPPIYRLTVNRFYYALYHATRALVFFMHGGDDYQEHKVVPTHIPGDFPDSQTWQNDLKDARTLRNEVDYNPYPAADINWQPAAVKMTIRADTLIPLVKNYLRGKGCSGL